jgi:hypothetical protein
MRPWWYAPKAPHHVPPLVDRVRDDPMPWEPLVVMDPPRNQAPHGLCKTTRNQQVMR